MKKVKGTIVAALAVAAGAYVSSVAVMARQGAPQVTATRMPMAEEVFKNIQVMRGVPADEFMASMGYISNALAVNCTYCHLGDGGGGWGEYARDNEPKNRARQMYVMMNAINRSNFGGRQVVTCISCHNGQRRPAVTANMARYYGVATTDEPTELTAQAPGAPSVDEILDKYLQALGGADKLKAVTSLVGKGTFISYGEAESRPAYLYAKAPNQRTEVLDTRDGPATITFDGQNGWSAWPESFTPLSWRPLRGAELDGARLDAQLTFPAQIKSALTNWVGSVPATMGDADVYVIQGREANGFPVKLYFDFDSGLLVRQIRYIESPTGRNTWQIDYSDYGDVAGVKVPFKWTLFWQSGTWTVELTDVQANVPIDAARFAAPPRPGAPRP